MLTNVQVAFGMVAGLSFVIGCVFTFFMEKRRHKKQEKWMVRVLTENLEHATSRLQRENKQLREENEKLKKQTTEPI